jgi:hypothetical protein
MLLDEELENVSKDYCRAITALPTAIYTTDPGHLKPLPVL